MDNRPVVKNKFDLKILELADFKIGRTYRAKAKYIIEKYGTGKSRRLSQLWATLYEIKVNDYYYMVKIYDQPQDRDEVQAGSDFE